MEYREIVGGVKRLNREILERMDAPETFESASDAARFLLETREAVDALEEVVKMSTSLLKLIKEAKCPDAFDLDGVQNVTLMGHRFSRTSTMRCSYREGQKEPALGWLRANDLGDIIIPYVPPQTLAATARGLAEDNQSLPDAFFNTYFQNGISITKTKP